MTDTLRCISPIDNSVYVERPLATAQQSAAALVLAQDAQSQWRLTSVAQRQELLSAMVDAFIANSDVISEEICRQMGRPLSQCAGEVRGFEERARHMIAIAPQALADVQTSPRDGFQRFIRKESLGVVFIIAPWNYPYLTAVNSIVPALMAGNAVLLKHSAQTPLCSERLVQASEQAGLPQGLLQALHLSHSNTSALVANPDIAYVAFTGSVPGGHAIVQAAADRFIGIGLELGGKDPAYVRADADIGHAVENIMDGVFFNSGQSCCGIERVYVHQDHYDEFVQRSAAFASEYQLGDPTDPQTNIGPMVRTSAADFVREQISQALSAGAHCLVDENNFPASAPGTPYLAPQLLVDVDHSMRIMHEETFGPAAGIMRVSSDEEAIALMNDSEFGLTASVWTHDDQAALKIGAQLQTGTVFMNRCDYLDPALAWTGVKNSGHGCSLSMLGYEQLTQPKSFHLRMSI